AVIHPGLRGAGAEQQQKRGENQAVHHISVTVPDAGGALGVCGNGMASRLAACFVQRRRPDRPRRLDQLRIDALEIELLGRRNSLQTAHDFTRVCSVWYLNCLRASSSRIPPRTALRIAFSASWISSPACSTLSSCSLGITTTPSASPRRISPGCTRASPIVTGTLVASTWTRSLPVRI